MLLCIQMFTRFAALALQLPADPNQFAPIDQLPQTEQLPAAPLLVGAYMFIVVALIAYVWLVWRRVGKVETEVRALAARSLRGNGDDGGNG